MAARRFLSSLGCRIAGTTIVVLAGFLLCVVPVRAEKRVALVIGNSAYVSVPRLDNPRNDARLMADTLRDLGFTIVGGGAQFDLTEQAFRQIVQDFGKQLQGSDVGLFYYAGHGVQVRGSNYLVPVDANPTREVDVDFQMLDANLVLLQMEGAGTKLNLVILDACRNNPLAGRGLRTVTSGLATMQSPEGTLISFATQPGSVAQDGEDGHSPYTEALAKTMRKPGLDIFRAFNEVGLAVDAATGGTQRPWVSLSPIRGDFYFTGPVSIDANVTVNAPAPDPVAQAWAVTRDTTSIAVVEDFIRQFGNNAIYGSMARARLEELKKTRVTNAPLTWEPTTSLHLFPKQDFKGNTPLLDAPKDKLKATLEPVAPTDNFKGTQQRAILYEEDRKDKNSPGNRYDGTVTWHMESVWPTAGRPSELAVRADVQIPALKMWVTFLLRHNSDLRLPASHAIQITFRLPPDFREGNVEIVPGILATPGEQIHGSPLIGTTLKAANNDFLIGLSSAISDVQHNADLLKEGWLDIPIVYTTGQRALLALEKGPSGDNAFAALQIK